MTHEWTDRGEGKAEELREILGTVTEMVPNLLRGLRDIVYSAEAAGNMADAVATFYKKLVDAGIPREEAMDMAKGYMINLRDLLGGKGINIGSFMDRDREDD